MVLTQKITLILSIFLLSLLSLPLQSHAFSISDFTPVSHWTCDEEGGVRYDSVTATGNDLNDNNTVGFATGILGNACDFELSNSEYLSKSSDTTFPVGNTARTFSVWYNAESFPADTYSPFISYGEQSICNDEFSFVVLNYGGTFYGVDNFCAGDFTSEQSLSISTWYHVVVVYDTTNFYFYQNGTLVDTISSSLNTGSDDNFKIGRRWTSSMYFDGLMDEITVFDYALDSTQVSTLYNSGTPLAYSAGTPPVEPAATTTPTTTISSASDFLDTTIYHFLIIFLITFFGFIFYFKQNNQ